MPRYLAGYPQSLSLITLRFASMISLYHMESQNLLPDDDVEASSNDRFEHTPLDKTPNSIRLLKILPGLSDTGLVQCEMWHDTTDAEYTCLSYVWGVESDQQSLFINGKSFVCRKNLWRFLNAARSQFIAEPKVFWIDAICINQASIPERNHQVSQMGKIYSKATDVLAWLGCDPGAVAFLNFLTRLAAEHPQIEKDARRIWHRESTKQLQHSYLEFEANEYWTRAWITQEILQAQKFSVLVNQTQIHDPEFEVLALLLPTLEKMVSKSGRKRESFWRNTERCFEVYIRAMAGYAMHFRLTAGMSHLIEKKLLDLLFFLGPRGCQVPRDRVYSLLAIANDADLVPVDYGMPEHVFISLLLISYNKCMCLCSLARLADVLDCVGPFTGSAPQSLLVKLSLTATKTQLEARPTVGLTQFGRELLEKDPQRIVCSQCDSEILVDPIKELVFCLREECDNWDQEGHLVISNMNETQSSGTSTLKLVARHKEGSTEYPRLFEHPVDMVSFEIEERLEEDFFLRLMEPPLYSIVLPFASLINVVLRVVNDNRTLCQKAEKLMAGFNFLDKNILDLRGL
jgi:hypothetical protein